MPAELTPAERFSRDLAAARLRLADLEEAAAELERETRAEAVAESVPPRLLVTVAEAAAMLSVGRSTAYGLIRSGELETVTVGRRRLVPTAALVEYVERLRG